jgi:SAM-dependent methyltransferase
MTADNDTSSPPSYASRLEADMRFYADREVVHDLPPIFHYWSNRHMRPILEGFGVSGVDDFFLTFLRRAFDENPGRPGRCMSLGAGNCDTEVRLGRLLVDAGVDDFVIECLEINPEMLARGRGSVSDAGLDRQVLPVQGDFNDWSPTEEYDVVLANQSLHHVANLEGLFAAAERALPRHGRFVTSDMIGRNGHLRWPEALKLVREYWEQLPHSYRFNVQLQRQEEQFQDWDCSSTGFEGIRSQDILPLLVERFDFELFIPFGNVIDPFIDRSFGPHFDPDRAWDQTFIDSVHHRDEVELKAGRIKPTHMLAAMRTRPFAAETLHRPPLTPQFCVRPPDD